MSDFGDDVAMVEQAIDESGRTEVIAEVVAPAVPGDVAGDDGRRFRVRHGLMTTRGGRLFTRRNFGRK